MSLTKTLPAQICNVSLSDIAVCICLMFAALSGLPHLPGLSHLNSDTIWLIEVAEQVLAGKVLYRDVVETNPPMSVLLYVPPVAVAQLIGVQSETAVVIYTLLFAAASAWLSIRLLIASRWYANQQLFLIGIGLLVLMALMPKFIATQREHIAAMAALPFVLLTALHVGERPVHSLALRLASGAGAALCVCIKPHFALALMLPVLCNMIMSRSIKSLITMEILIAGVLVLAFSASVTVLFPDYFSSVLPIVLDIYVPQRIPLFQYAFSEFSFLFYVLVAVAMPALLHPFARGPAAVVFLSAIGFFMAFLLQGKGWTYHLYGALQMLAIAVLLAQFPCGPSTAETRVWRFLRLIALVLTVTILGGLFVKTTNETGHLQAVLADVPKPASVLIVTEHHELIFPAIRRAGLTWASRTNGTWLAENAIRQLRAPGEISPKQQVLLANAIVTMRRWLREDMEAMRPEIVVFHHSPVMDWERFAMEDAAFASLMQDYRPVESFVEGGIHRLKVYRKDRPKS